VRDLATCCGSFCCKRWGSDWLAGCWELRREWRDGRAAAVFGKLLPVHAALAFPWRSIAAGIGTGLLTTLLFCLPPLLDVRAVRPVLVLRRLVEQGPEGIGGWFARWWARRMQLGISVIVVAALGGIAWALSDSAKVGIWFAVLFAIALLVLLVMAAVALRTVRFLLNRVRLRLPSFLRHGLANLYRPGNQSAAVLAALGTGVMLILAVYLMQASMLREIRETASPKLPNIFLVDMTTDEIAGVKDLFQHQAWGNATGASPALDLMPMVTVRFVSLNGKTLEQLKDQHFPRRMLESARVSWADTAPDGDKVTQGKWWTTADAAEMAVGEGTAQRLHLGVGSAVQMEIGGVVRTLKVAAIYRADGQHLGVQVQFVLPSGELKDEPATWFGGRTSIRSRWLRWSVRCSRLIDNHGDQPCDVLVRIESVVDQITFVVRFLRGSRFLPG